MAAILAQKPLWSTLTYLSEKVTGKPLESIVWQPGTTPMSTFKSTAIAMAVYYVTIFGGREVMRTRPAFKFNLLFQIHNLGLTIISGTLLVLFLEQLIPTLVEKGVYHGVCTLDGGWTPQLVALYYVCFV
jgi:fatty acid elongase 3